ncbi:MAG: GGDEF domain-containing protein, partial [Congregibacter sp.]|nr:GGDEF domain-containing protein [Congregibacter sp.]
GHLSKALGDEYSGLREGRDQALAMQAVMNAGVEQIQSRIATESDITALKAGVSQSLEGIRKGLSDFIEKDAERFLSSEARNEELRTRLQKMEDETRELQQKLDRNREKLMRDTLTGAHSRLAYDEMLAQEMSRFRRYQETFCLVMLDIDFFKRVNDSYGHAAGDKALQLVASIVSERIRESDYLFRVGGEEFVLLLPRTQLDAAVPLIETIRLAVGDSGFHYENKPVQITLSAGLTPVHQEDTPETLFARADDAMYRAKKAGRNRLVSLD